MRLISASNHPFFGCFHRRHGFINRSPGVVEPAECLHRPSPKMTSHTEYMPSLRLTALRLNPEVIVWTATEALRRSGQKGNLAPLFRAPSTTRRLFVRQSDKLIDERTCCRVIPTEDMGTRCERQRHHQRGGLADLARILERVISVR